MEKGEPKHVATAFLPHSRAAR